MSNKDIVRRVAEEPWGGDYTAVDELIAPDYTGHDPSQPDTTGPQGVKEFYDQFRSAYPDGKLTIDQQWEDGDYVISKWTGTGTHQGELMGIQATGKQVTVTGITISQVSGGKITEEWTVWDTLGMLQQLGAVPAAEGAPTT
jgi:steroid delta-isomerase-like uncharacterized protein